MSTQISEIQSSFHLVTTVIPRLKFDYLYHLPISDFLTDKVHDIKLRWRHLPISYIANFFARQCIFMVFHSVHAQHSKPKQRLATNLLRGELSAISRIFLKNR